MKNLDYKKLIEENKVYYIKYGRGAVIGVANESLKDGSGPVHEVITALNSCTQEPALIKSIEFIDDYVIFDIIITISTSRGFMVADECEYKATKKIPLSQITFESFQLNN
jgi:hypothetical protein